MGELFIVNVELDLKKQIARGRIVNVNRSKLWVPLEYEKLPRMFFTYGQIVRDASGCTGNQSFKEEGWGNQFGSWLKAKNSRIKGVFNF